MTGPQKVLQKCCRSPPRPTSLLLREGSTTSLPFPSQDCILEDIPEGPGLTLLPVDGRDIPHVEAGQANLLQECMGQFRSDVIDCIQLLGGIVIADKQPNLNKDGKSSELDGSSLFWTHPGDLCCVLSQTLSDTTQFSTDICH